MCGGGNKRILSKKTFDEEQSWKCFVVSAFLTK